MDIKLKIVRNELLKRSSFKYDGSNGSESLRILNNATDLSGIIITIKKNFNTKQYDFRYNHKKRKFVRLNNLDNIEHFTVYTRCRMCSTPCFKSEYSTIQFLKLCKNVFEPISVKLA